MKSKTLLQMMSVACLVLALSSGCNTARHTNQQTGPGNSTAVSNNNSGNVDTNTHPTGEPTTVLAPVQYAAAQLGGVRKSAGVANVTTPLLPALNLQGQAISHIQAGDGQTLMLSYPNMMVMESSRSIQNHGTGAVVSLTNGSTAKWTTLSSGSKALTFRYDKTYVSLIPVHQGSNIDKESFQTIAESFRTVDELSHPSGQETTPLTLENIQVTDRALVVTTTKGQMTTAYRDPHIANGQFIVTLQNTRPGKFDVNQTTPVESQWAKNMRIAQQGTDLVLTFDLQPSVRTFATSIGSGDMLAFTFQ